jgi:hypothetical protein
MQVIGDRRQVLKSFGNRVVDRTYSANQRTVHAVQRAMQTARGKDDRRHITVNVTASISKRCERGSYCTPRIR